MDILSLFFPTRTQGGPFVKLHMPKSFLIKRWSKQAGMFLNCQKSFLQAEISYNLDWHLEWTRLTRWKASKGDLRVAQMKAPWPSFPAIWADILLATVEVEQLSLCLHLHLIAALTCWLAWLWLKNPLGKASKKDEKKSPKWWVRHFKFTHRS